MTLTKLNIEPKTLLSPIRVPAIKPRLTVNPPKSLRFAQVYFNVMGGLMPAKAAEQALQLFSKPRRRYSTRKFDDLVTQSKRFDVTSNGNRIEGHIWENSGETVLLVHGWETGGLHLGTFIEPLWAEGYKVITFDGPAHGSSQGEFTNLPDFARTIAQIHTEVGPVQHIIAHSFGGFASVFMASQESITLKSMTLVSVPNKLSGVLDDFARMLKLPNQVLENIYLKIRAYFNVDPGKIESAKLGKLMEVDRVLVVHDRNDYILPFHNSLEIVHDLSNARLLETENLGHNRLLKHPQVISRIVQFLNLDGPWEQ
jgi:pimeloyl-ACP methyl ester carboxylesterase